MVVFLVFGMVTVVPAQGRVGAVGQTLEEKYADGLSLG